MVGVKGALVIDRRCSCTAHRASPAAHHPHGGVRPSHQKSTCTTQSILGPCVEQTWSRNTPESGVNETFVLHRMDTGLPHQECGQCLRLAVASVRRRQFLLFDGNVVDFISAVILLVKSIYVVMFVPFGAVHVRRARSRANRAS